MILPTTMVEPFFRTTARGSGFQFNKQDERDSLAYQAWAAHLRGQVDEASAAFQQAEALEREIDSSVQYHYSLRGIWHAEHLRRVGQADYARRVTAANLTICEQERWPDDTSRCHRVLGELDADAGGAEDIASARDHFDTALTLARAISDRAVLIEALLARGRWAAKLAHAADLTGGPPTSPPPKDSMGHLSDTTFRLTIEH